MVYIIVCTRCGRKEVYSEVTWFNHMPVCDSCIAEAVINSSTKTKES